MCRTVRLLLFIISLSLTGIAWAADQILIRVNGLSGEMEKNVNLALQSEKQRIIQPITADSFQDFYKKAPKTIEQAMQPFGYFHPTIQSSSSRYKNNWTITFNIIQGPPVRISEVSVGIVGPAKNHRAFKKLYIHLPIQVGDTLNTENYEKTKQLLYDLASTRGYFDAKMLQNKIYINLKTNLAQIYIKFESGPRYYFGNTMFSDTPFSPSFLTRFLRYKKGKHYNYHKIERTQQDFINSNYFSQVIINPVTKDKENQQVPINIKLVPRKRYAYTLGAGYGTDTGIRGTIGYEARYLNQYGHQLKALIQGSENNSFANVTYYIPGYHPASDTWAFTAGYVDFNQVTGDGNSVKLQAAYSTALGNWSQTIALTYLNERYNLINFPFNQTDVVYPNISWQYVSTRNTVNPKNGFSFSGFMGGTPNTSLTDTSFFQIRAHAKVLFTLFDCTRFILRTSLARTDIEDLEKLPFSLQLFAGGARSIRGYSYNQIGPGRNLFTGSIEIQQRIAGNWYLVGFWDAGNVTDNSPFKNLNEGAGPGIAWLSPVGIIEVTVANAFTQSTKPWVIQFTMGPEL